MDQNEVVRPPRRRRAVMFGAVAFVVMIAAGGFALASGGGSDGNDVATANNSNTGGSRNDSSSGSEALTEEQALRFSQCMRDHGLPEFPDPTVDGEGNVQIFRRGADGAPPDIDPQSETFQDALEACRELLPALPFNDENQAELQDQLLELAQCMRDNGVPEFPDPDFSGGGLGSGGPGGIFQQLDPDDPRIRDALEHCQSKVFGDNGFGGPFIGGPGGGPGGGGGIARGDAT